MEMEKLESMKDEFMAHHSEKVISRSKFSQDFYFISYIFIKKYIWNFRVKDIFAFKSYILRTGAISLTAGK